MVNPTTGPATMSMMSNITAGLPSSGVYVTEITALNLLIVWTCTNILSQSMSVCPIQLHEKKTKKIIDSHPLNKLLNLIPNPEMSSYQWRSVIMNNCGLWGNSFCEIERDGAGRPLRLWPIMPWRVYVRRIAGEIMYQVILIAGGTVWLRPDQMLHIRGLSTDGLVGLSPIRAGCEAIGLGLAAQVSAGKAFSNDNPPMGTVTVPMKVSDGAAKRIRESVESGHKGLNNAHRIMLLEEGMTFTPNNMNPVDMQLLESRRFTREEIGGMYRIPMHKLGILEKATNNNIEQQALEFIQDCLTPWAKNIEQEIMIKLFTPAEQDTLILKHDMDEISRGDIKTRYSAYGSAKQWGILNTDEVRAKEYLPPLPAGAGQVYLNPMNMIPAGSTPPVPAAAPKPKPEAEPAETEPELVEA